MRDLLIKCNIYGRMWLNKLTDRSKYVEFYPAICLFKDSIDVTGYDLNVIDFGSRF